ncbi:hypothetical protein PR202_ga17177 [Eleusine coracana subsp. coracana]|uniref:FAS1 domain-containing protein n=1 Tax=Eleusine coracana subsp. coracana TaxID=191504 RepID=A0AAV5CNA9_ELECO|nr:hypothetical protein PR202_ga17177 [Eleusine coracana subsp. coracana]
MSLRGGALLPLLLLLLLLLVLSASPMCHAASSHNITGILAAHPEFSAFSTALSSTGAAAEINRRNTVTVLAVDDAAMAAARGLRPEDLKRVIYLHVLLDYFDEAKLGSLQADFAQAASLFQASGHAAGGNGIVNITARQGGRVAFTAAAAASGAAFYEKSVHQSPYDISVLQVNALISSPASAPAPRSSSSQDRTTPSPAPAKAAVTPAPAAPATAKATPPAPAPVAAPATTPIPRRRPAPEPESATAPSPDADADDTPLADQKNSGARSTASWTLGVAAALPAMIVLVL